MKFSSLSDGLVSFLFLTFFRPKEKISHWPVINLFKNQRTGDRDFVFGTDNVRFYLLGYSVTGIDRRKRKKNASLSISGCT